MASRQADIPSNTSETCTTVRYRRHSVLVMVLIRPDYAYTYTVRKRRSDETLQESQRDKQLLKAAAAGHTSRVRYLLQLGADRDFSEGEDGFTALHNAAFSGFEDTARVLLEEGADVAAQSLDFGTPLHVAALRGRVNVLRLFLDDFRANPDAESRAVGLPLHCACASGDSETISALLTRVAAVDSNALVDFRLVFPDPNARRQSFITETWECQPLFVATWRGNLDGVVGATQCWRTHPDRSSSDTEETGPRWNVWKGLTGGASSSLSGKHHCASCICYLQQSGDHRGALGKWSIPSEA